MAAQSTMLLDRVYQMAFELQAFVTTKCMYQGEYCIVLLHRKLYSHHPFGLTSRCRILVKKDEYVVDVLMRRVESGSLKPDSVEKDFLQVCRKYSSESEFFKFCPGINITEYEGMKEVIRFDLKSVHQTHEPFKRIESIHCLLWYELGKTSRRESREADAVMCSACVRLKCNLAHQMKRTEAESPSKKLKRQSTSSRARLKYMSPYSQKQRKENQQKERKNMKKRCDHYDAMEIPLDDEQNTEMDSITSRIEQDYPQDLEKLFIEGMRIM